MYTDAMIDLETFGLNSEAPIITIGVVLFNAYLDNPNQVMDRREFVLDVQDLLAKGFKVDISTIAFWMKQSNAARMHIVDLIDNDLVNERNPGERTGYNIHTLYALSDYIEENCDPQVRVWGNDSIFDIGKLIRHYEAYDMPVPWKWYNVSCYRTKKRDSNAKFERIGTLHNACDDAESQARHLVRILMED